jgi:hypothetical protein
MRFLNVIEWLRKRRQTVARVGLALLVVLVLLDALPGAVDKAEAHTWLEESVPGFWALFGFLGCAVLIILSKWLGRLGVSRREDYYDE